MAGYTRQSTMADGDTITAALFNNEYNQLVNAFSNTSGHAHDGTAANGPVIGLIGDAGETSPNNKVVIDTTNNYIEFYVEVSSSPVQQLYIADGAIIPVTDNDIDLGTSSLEFKDLYIDGTANLDSLVLGSGSTVTAILDEDDLSSDSATSLATQQSIKAYVDAQVTAQDLDFQGDSGGALSIDLDSESLTIAGGAGIDTSGATNTLTVAIDSTVATLTGTQTLTNKTIDAASNTLSNIANSSLTNSSVSYGGVSVALGGTDATPAFNLSDATAYPGDSSLVTTGALNSGSITSGFGAIDNGSSNITTTGTVTYGSLSDGVITITAFADEDDMVSNSATLVPTQQSVKAYVDSQVATANELSELTDVNLTTPADASLLFYDTTTSKWIDNVVSGDITIADTGVAAISSGVIVNDDINASAAISVSKTALTAGTGLTLSTDTLSVDAAQTQITSVGTLSALTVAGNTTFNTGDVLFTGASANILFDQSANALEFADNAKAQFGTGNDLQIYHDGSNSLIQDAGTGDLIIKSNGTATVIKTNAGNNLLSARDAGSVGIFHDGSEKLTTTSTGIDVTGTAVVDGLTVDGAVSGTAFLDDDTFATATASTLASSESIKAYVDSSVGGVSSNSITDADGDTKIQVEESADEDIIRFDTAGSQRMVIDASGNVGIGTASPSEILEINTSSRFTGRLVSTDATASAGPYLTLFRDSASPAASDDIGGLLIKGNNASGAETSMGIFKMEITDTTAASEDADWVFINRNAGTLPERFRIQANGNIGIGTSSPSAELHVKGTGQIARLESTSATGNNYLSYYDSSALKGHIGYTGGSDDDFNLYNAENSNIKLFTNGSERMRIDSSGSLLVGKTSLGIAGDGFEFGAGVLAVTRDGGVPFVANRRTSDGEVIAIRKDNTTVGSIGTQNWGIGTSSPDTLLTMQDDSTVNGSLLTFKNQYRVSTTTADTMGGIAFSAWRDVSTSASYCAAIYGKNTGYPGSSGNLIFATRTNGDTDPTDVPERMRIDSSGNVGIGTTAPQQNLEISDASTPKIRFSRGTSYYWDIGHTNSDFQFESETGGVIMHMNFDGNVGIGTTSPSAKLHIAGDDAFTALTLTDNTSSADMFSITCAEYVGSAPFNMNKLSASNSSGISFETGGSERMRLLSNGDVGIGTTSNIINSSSGVGIYFENGADLIVGRNGGAALSVLRQGSDGQLVRFKQAGTEEGNISVSGATVSYNGFSGNHETSGIPANTEIGTVCSTIDELDTYVSGTKSGQTRADHAKIKVSDVEGDSRVYGVLASFSETDNKPIVASVGIGSVKVTGACSGGDLLESNGDGTAKVQSDDIIRSKTIGKVTIGNSNTGVKLVSCVLYCG